MQIPFIEAKHHGVTMPNRAVRWLVIHTAETQEGPNSAVGVANYFRDVSPVGSAHFCVDSTRIIQCVGLNTIANAAPGANREGVHIELCGKLRRPRRSGAIPTHLQN